MTNTLSMDISRTILTRCGISSDYERGDYVPVTSPIFLHLPTHLNIDWTDDTLSVFTSQAIVVIICTFKWSHDAYLSIT